MFWKCIPDTQFEKQIQEKNKSLKCPGCQSSDCTTGQEEEVCLTPTGRAESRDARSSLEQLSVNLVNSTQACHCLISPTFTEELGLRNLMGKKKSPQLQQDKKQSIKDLAKEIKRWILEEDEMGNGHGKDIQRVCW